MQFRQQAIKEITGNFYTILNEHTDDYVVEWNEDTPVDKATIEAKAEELKTAYDNAEAQKATNKASGNQKLLDLGLSQAEVDALTK
jgi:hypothetical protein